MKEVELVIIGAGPTGLFATFCAGLRAINSVTLESLDNYGGQMKELYPEKIVYDVQGTPKMVSAQLVEKMYEQSQTFKSPVILNSNVTDIAQNSDKTFNVEVDGELAYKSRAILICAGIGKFSPNKLNVEGEDKYNGRGVYYGAKSPSSFKDKRIIIVGGGDSAFDYALQLEQFAKSIIIVQHNEVLKAAEDSILMAKKSQKIKIILNTEIKRIIGNEKTVTRVALFDVIVKKESLIDLDSVIIATGHKASPNVFKSLSLETSSDRYIKVDTNYKTNIEGVYAAGDIANVTNEPKFALLIVGGAEAYIAVNNIKKYLSPSSPLFGGHSSSAGI
jgi:thioredoxin reductase (NADPH)